MADTSYPAELEQDVALRDGATVRIRAGRPDDLHRLQDYVIGLSTETRRLRFWGASVDVGKVAAEALDQDYVTHLTLLAFSGGDEGRIVGGAQYFSIDAHRAEVSFSVADDMQGRGLGSLLLERLAGAAATHHVQTFLAHVLPENHVMIDVFRESGFDVSIRAIPGSIDVEFPTSSTPEAIQRFDRRRFEASVNAVRGLLCPSSIAVIGASRDPDSIGGRLFHNLIDGEFHGPVYPVNPNADVVHGVPAYDSVSDIDGPVDVAFVAVPARAVPDAARDAARHHVRGLVVISAGFAESGGDGPERQRELLAICRASGMRLVGPNCMGLVNTDPSIRMNGTFASTPPPEGRVGFLSQSGALGIAVMDHATRLGLGLSSFASVGNKADIDANDLIAYWSDDDRTDVILLYLESIIDARRFARLAPATARDTPIVVVKSGRSAAGVRATASHTGSLLAASDVTVDALFRQSGVIRTDTLEEMFDVATFLANQPPPRGHRVAIVTNAGGLGILCADTCEAEGLVVAPLAERTVAALSDILPAAAATENPVDMVASADGDDYRRTIVEVARDPGVDAVIVLYIPPLESAAPDVARGIVEATRAVDGAVPILTTFMSTRGLPDVLQTAEMRIPSYTFPEQAAIALARVSAYGTWRERPRGRVPSFPEVRVDRAAGVIATALERGDVWLDPSEVETLLSCYGIPTVESIEAAGPEEAAAAAARIGGRIALKAIGPDLIHKTDIGAVALDVPASEVAERARGLLDAVQGAGVGTTGFLVQRMVPAGVEMLIGMTHDPVFGPVIAVGAGGTSVELLHDVAVRITPITDLDAPEMVRELATFPLLNGYRGAPKVDVAGLEHVLLRISALVEDHPSVSELDLNPVVALPDGVVVVDSRIRVASASRERS
ncbi:MAG TPA: GNAT family N-acetyltransferase [Actinomycetota bacterium]|nr:GNAT family N-acetyltransferase [Actinomycetota bacterium]